MEEYAGRTATRFEKRIEWNEGRIMWWLMEGGAKPTTRVVFLLEKVSLNDFFGSSVSVVWMGSVGDGAIWEAWMARGASGLVL